MSRPLRTAALLGAGAMGETLLRALRRAGIRVELAWNRSQRPRPWTTALGSVRAVDLVLLAVADGAVAEVCGRLDVGPGQLVAHVAGALDLSSLAPARRKGARTGSLHPLRAVVRGARTRLDGAFAGVAGSDPVARSQLSTLARRLGMRPLPVPDDRRALYHAAAMLAAGAGVGLFSEASRVFRSATGAPELRARAALLELATGALASLRERSPARALTGPVARGDSATVRAHRRALPEDLLPLYDALLVAMLRLAREGKRAPAAELDALARLLRDG